MGCVEIPPSNNKSLSPLPFEQRILIGKWKTVSTIYPINETLRLYDNGTFEHTFQDQATLHIFTDQGDWFVEQRPSGCVYLHLIGMRYFHNGVDQGRNNNKEITGTLIRFEDSCEHRTFVMPDKVILTVANLPSYYQRIGLFFPRTTTDESYISMELQL